MCQVSDYKVLAGAFEYEKKKSQTILLLVFVAKLSKQEM